MSLPSLPDKQILPFCFAIHIAQHFPSRRCLSQLTFFESVFQCSSRNFFLGLLRSKTGFFIKYRANGTIFCGLFLLQIERPSPLRHSLLFLMTYHCTACTVCGQTRTDHLQHRRSFQSFSHHLQGDQVDTVLKHVLRKCRVTVLERCSKNPNSVLNFLFFPK